MHQTCVERSRRRASAFASDDYLARLGKQLDQLRQRSSSIDVSVVMHHNLGSGRARSIVVNCRAEMEVACAVRHEDNREVGKWVIRIIEIEDALTVGKRAWAIHLGRVLRIGGVAGHDVETSAATLKEEHHFCRIGFAHEERKLAAVAAYAI